MGEKKPLCEFGQKIEICLVKINRTNAWLIDQVAKDTGKYFDRSYLHKIKTGEAATPGIVASICRILAIPHDTTERDR